MTTDNTDARVPLSRFVPRRTLMEFLDELNYGGTLEGVGASRPRPGTRERFQNDVQLLQRLHGELRRVSPGERPAIVGDLSPAVVAGIVEDLEVERHRDGWRLAGDESEDIFARLDRHFEDVQQAGTARRRARDEAQIRNARGSAELSRMVGARDDAQARALWGLPAA